MRTLSPKLLLCSDSVDWWVRVYEFSCITFTTQSPSALISFEVC